MAKLPSTVDRTTRVVPRTAVTTPVLRPAVVTPPVLRPVPTTPLPPVPGGAVTPAAPRAAPATGLRGGVINIGSSDLSNQAGDSLSRALASLQDTANLRYKAVAGPSYGKANSLLDQAAGAAGGITVKGVSGPALSNTGKSQGLLDKASQAYGGLDLKTFGTVAAQNPNETYDSLAKALAASNSPEQAKLRQMSMADLEALHSAPNRGELAARSLALQRALTQDQWLKDQRTVGDNAAAFGRTGSGMTTNELTDLTLAREKALGLYGEQAALEAAGLEMGDRLNTLGATTGYQGQVSAEDLARAGFTQGNALAKFGVGSTVRGQNVDERNFQATQAMNQAQVAQARAAGLGSLVGDQYNIDTTGFNQGMARSGLDLQSQVARANAAASRSGALTGIGGQYANQATNTANFNAGQSAQDLQARQAAQAMKQSLASTVAGIQGQTFGQDQARSSLAAQQQARQDQQAQQAIANRAAQEQLQEQLLNGEFNRTIGAAGAAGSIGYGNDPYSLQLAAAQGQGAQAAAGRTQLEEAAAAAAMRRALATAGLARAA